ncbi:polymer-forming cytoskeletal protein [Candidatus Hydrogenedentota bacterium]
MSIFSVRNKQESKNERPRKGKSKHVVCPYCDTAQDVAHQAKSVFCRKCHKWISFECHKFDDKRHIGDIVTRGTVNVGKKGDVKGSVVASDITVSGKFTGRAEASGTIRLLRSAVFVGELKSGHLVMSDGATFVGGSDVKLTSNSDGE